MIIGAVRSVRRHHSTPATIARSLWRMRCRDRRGTGSMALKRGIGPFGGVANERAEFFLPLGVTGPGKTRVRSRNSGTRGRAGRQPRGLEGGRCGLCIQRHRSEGCEKPLNKRPGIHKTLGRIDSREDAKRNKGPDPDGPLRWINNPGLLLAPAWPKVRPSPLIEEREEFYHAWVEMGATCPPARAGREGGGRSRRNVS